MSLTFEQTEILFGLNPSIAVIRGDVAYNKDGNEVSYDKQIVEDKLAELQAAEAQAEQAAVAAKQSALTKLAALGLTQAEINALIG